MSKRGRPRNQAIAALMTTKQCSRATAYRQQAKKAARKLTQWQRMENAPQIYNELIKPSDNWNFSEVGNCSTHPYTRNSLIINAFLTRQFRLAGSVDSVTE